jgi:pimeloyl-ACP methyl ester carboxylesterase
LLRSIQATRDRSSFPHGKATKRWVSLRSTRPTGYGDLIAPIIIITGERDEVVSRQHHAMALAALVPAAKLIMLTGVGHMPHHAGPEQVVR